MSAELRVDVIQCCTQGTALRLVTIIWGSITCGLHAFVKMPWLMSTDDYLPNECSAIFVIDGLMDDDGAYDGAGIRPAGHLV